MVGLGVFAIIFVAIFGWIFYELYKAPLVDDNDEIIEKDNSFIEFDEDEEFL